MIKKFNTLKDKDFSVYGREELRWSKENDGIYWCTILFGGAKNDCKLRDWRGIYSRMLKIFKEKIIYFIKTK